jgi:purine-cytosine permease-like protein
MNSKDVVMNELKTQLFGWILFLICAVLFTLSGLRVRDALSTAASLLFLLACLVFLIPLVRAIRNEEKSE